MKAPKDRMEMLLEAIYSKVERMETIMDRKPATDQSQPSTTAIPGDTELQEIKKQLTGIRDDLNNKQAQSESVRKHHYLWFFPDLKEWLTTLKSGKFMVLLSLLSLALLTVILLEYPDYKNYQKSYYKYQYLFYASEDEESLKKYDEEWAVDSLKEIRVNWVNKARLDLSGK